MSDQPTNIADFTFEQAQAELEQVVRKLEDQHTGLDDALALWERGEQLHAHCQSKLDYAAERIAQLQIDAAAAKQAQVEHDGAFDEASEDSNAAADESSTNGTPSMF